MEYTVIQECIRMLNGLDKALEQKVAERDRRWQLAQEMAVYGVTPANNRLDLHPFYSLDSQKKIR